MAIIYTYPNLPLSSLSADDLLVITNVDATNNNPTKSVTLADIATYVTGTGSGTGTTNKIVKFTDGANGLLGDSIMTESTGLIDLAGQFVSTSSPTLTQAAPVSGIKAILNGTTAAPNVALYGDSKHTGGTQADSNYGLYAKGEFEGTGGFTGFAIGGNLEGRYDGTGTNGANASVYGSFSSARATSAANGTISYMIGANNTAKIESANVTAANLQGAHTGVNLTNGTAGDVIVQILDFDGTGGTVTGDLSYLQIQNDTMPTVAGTSRAIKSLSVLPSLFTGQVEIPLVPTINAHATSKQYVDQQISNVVSGLVFISTWDASSTPGGSPDLTDASTKVVGHYYVVSVAGSATPNGAGTLPNSWNVGDWCIYVEQGATDRWEKLDQTFVSGAGATGQVTYWNSQNEVAGDNDLFFDSTNKRLGIGTTSPFAKLHVSGDSSTNSAIRQSRVNTAIWDQAIDSNGRLQWGIRANEAGTRTLKFEIDDTGDVAIFPRGTVASSGSGILYFKNVDDNSATITGGSIRTVDSVNNPSGADMRFQVADDNGTLFDIFTLISSGFVGINTTAPDFALDVSGTARINTTNDNTSDLNSLILKRTWTNPGTNDRAHGILFSDFNSSMATIYADRTNSATNFNSDLLFATNTGTSGTALSTKMIIKNTGNVGIGTTSPAEKLHVFNEGTAMIKVDSGSTSPYKAGIEFLRSSVNGGRIYNDGNAVQVKLESDFGYDSANPTRGGFMFKTAPVTSGTLVDAVRIDAEGKVGIGNISPGAKLDVQGDGAEFFIRSLDYSVARIIPRGQTGTNIDKGLLSLFDTGTEDVRIDTAGNSWFNGGNVGIGTGTPTNGKLQIDSTSNQISLETGTAGDGRLNIGHFSNGAFIGTYGDDGGAADLIRFGTHSGDERMRIDSDGKVSIQNADGSTLNLRRDDTSIVSGNDLGSIFFQGNDPSSPFKSGAAIIGEGDGTWNMGTPNVYPSRLLFQTAKQDALITAMRISSDQNVGIGPTSSPGAKLEVANAAEGTYLIAGGDNASNSRALAFTSSTSGATNGALHTINAQSGNGIIAFATTSTERMRITSAGDVLLGTTAEPNGTSVYGSSFTSLSHDRMALKLASSLSTSIELVAFYNPNGKVGSITTNGSATAFNTSSDYRLKKNLKDFDGLDKVSKIPVYDFKWKVDDSSSYGVMAHELQEVLPDAVSGEKDGEEMQGVDYSKIVPLLIKSIQELEAKVKILENK